MGALGGRRLFGGHGKVRRGQFFLVFTLLALAAEVRGQDTELAAFQDSLSHIQARLFDAKRLACEFGQGTVANYEGVVGIDSGPELEADDTLTPSVFTDIDLAAQRARFGDAQVAVYQSGPALHFVETTPVGNLILTTVFATTFNDSGDFVAVTSRHIGQGIPGPPPIPSQFHGRCAAF